MSKYPKNYFKGLIMNKQKIAYTIGTLLFTTLFVYAMMNQKDTGNFLESSVLRDKSELRRIENDQITYARKNSITEAAKMVSPAVVGIHVNAIRQYSNPWYRMFYGDQVVQSLGSGVIISADGYILTNDHVAEGNEITVTLTDGTEHKANKIGSDPNADICLLKINAGKDLPYIKFGDSDDIVIGEWVIALGNPFGLFDINDKPTVTVGVISSIDMNMGLIDNRGYVDMIQTDAAINPGNSGGPLININGELIGLNTLIRGSDEGSQTNIGLGFAIPVNKIKKTISELKEKGEIDRHYWTGITCQQNDENFAKRFKLTVATGVVVTKVEDNSPSAKAGLKQLDVIIQVGKYKTSNTSSFGAVFYEFRTGDSVPLKIIRGDQTLTKEMKLERVQND